MVMKEAVDMLSHMSLEMACMTDPGGFQRPEGTEEEETWCI